MDVSSASPSFLDFPELLLLDDDVGDVDATEETEAELQKLREFIAAAKSGLKRRQPGSRGTASATVNAKDDGGPAEDEDKENKPDGHAARESRKSRGKESTVIAKGFSFPTAPAHGEGKVTVKAVSHEEQALVSRLPWLYHAGEKALTVMPPSSKAERLARDQARKRLVELLGPSFGATPETAGASHIPRPLRLKRLAEQEVLSSGGPGSYIISESAQTPYFNARVGATRGGCLVFGPPKDASGNVMVRKTKNGKVEAAPSPLLRQKARRLESGRKKVSSPDKKPPTVQYREVLLADLAEEQTDNLMPFLEEDKADEEQHEDTDNEEEADVVDGSATTLTLPNADSQQVLSASQLQENRRNSVSSSSTSSSSSGWGSGNSSWLDSDSSGFGSSDSDDDSASSSEEEKDNARGNGAVIISAAEAEQLLESLAAAVAQHHRQQQQGPAASASPQQQKQQHRQPPPLLAEVVMVAPPIDKQSSSSAVAPTAATAAPAAAAAASQQPPTSQPQSQPRPQPHAQAQAQRRDPRELLRRALEALPEQDKKAVATLLLRVRQMASHRASLKLLRIETARWDATHRKSFRGSTSFARAAASRSGSAGPDERDGQGQGQGQDVSSGSRKRLAEVRYKSKLRYARLENEQRKKEREEWFARERGADALAATATTGSTNTGGNAGALYQKATLRLRKALVALEALQLQQQQEQQQQGQHNQKQKQQRQGGLSSVDVREMLLSRREGGDSVAADADADIPLQQQRKQRKRRHSVSGGPLSVLSTTPFTGRAAVDWGASAKAESFSNEASKRKARLRGLLSAIDGQQQGDDASLWRLVAKRSRRKSSTNTAVIEQEVESFIENKAVEAKLVEAARLQLPPQQRWYSSQLHPEYGTTTAAPTRGRQQQGRRPSSAGSSCVPRRNKGQRLMEEQDDGAEAETKTELDNTLDWIRAIKGEDEGSVADHQRRKRLEQQRARQQEEAEAVARLPRMTIGGTAVFMGSKTPRFPPDRFEREGEMEAIFTHLDPDSGNGGGDGGGPNLLRRGVPSSVDFRLRRQKIQEEEEAKEERKEEEESKSAYTSDVEQGGEAQGRRAGAPRSVSSSRSRSRSRSRVSYSRMTGRDDSYDPFGRPPDNRLLVQGQASEKLKEKLLKAQRRRRREERRKRAAGESGASVGSADGGKTAESEAEEEEGDHDIALSFLEAAERRGSGGGGMVLYPRDDFVSTNRRLVYGRSFGKAQRFEGEDATAAGANSPGREAILMSKLAKALDLALPPNFSIAAAEGGGGGRDQLLLDPSAADSVTRKALKGQRFASFGKMAGRQAKISGGGGGEDAEDEEGLARLFSQQYGVSPALSSASALRLDYGAISKALNGGRSLSRGLYVDIAKRFNPRSEEDGEVSAQTLMKLLSRFAAKQARAAAEAAKQQQRAAELGNNTNGAPGNEGEAETATATASKPNKPNKLGGAQQDAGASGGEIGYEALELLADKLLLDGGGSTDSNLVTRPQKSSRAVRPRNVRFKGQPGRDDDDKQAPKLKKLKNLRVDERSLLELQLSEEGYEKLAEAGVSLQEYQDILFGPRPVLDLDSSGSAAVAAESYSGVSAAGEEATGVWGAYSSVLAGSGTGAGRGASKAPEPGALVFGNSAANVGAGAAAIGSVVNNKASAMSRMTGRPVERVVSEVEDEEAVRRAIDAMIIF